MSDLLLISGDGFNDRFMLDKSTMHIGRDPCCEIVLDHTSVSRRHASITKTPQGYLLEDLESTNGTQINNEPIRQALLSSGDVVQFGRFTARLIKSGDEDAILKEEVNHQPENTIFFNSRDLVDGQVRLKLLYDLAEATAMQGDQKALMKTALDLITRELECDYAYIGIFKKDSEEIEREYYSHVKDSAAKKIVSGKLLQKALGNRDGLLIKDTRTEDGVDHTESLLRSGTRSVMCVPMMVTGRRTGFVYADTRNKIQCFTAGDVAFLSAISSLLGSAIQNLEVMSDLKDRNRELAQQIDGDDLVGEDQVIVEASLKLKKFASKGDAPVLIRGESGTGKELAAKMIHRYSSRAHMPFLDINCAAVPHQLIESELFGHVKGAFTSATSNRRGLFEMADEGTLFLDEIGEMPLDLQSKLLRILETGEFRPLGSENTRKVNVRIVTATNRDLEEMIEMGSFRNDLFYRINVLSLFMPSLRDHPEDIPITAEHFLKRLRLSVSTKVEGFSPDAVKLMKQYPWPGNVRELRNAVERALYTCEDSAISPDDFEITKAATSPPSDASPTNSINLDETERLNDQVQELEKQQITEALDRNRWNKSKTADELGISRKKLLARIKKYGI